MSFSSYQKAISLLGLLLHNFCTLHAATLAPDQAITPMNTSVVIDVLANDRDNLDVVFANYNNFNRLCLGNGQGQFPLCHSISSDKRTTEDVAVSDLNADGQLDIIFANRHEYNQYCLKQSPNRSEFLCMNISTELRQTRGVAVADLNQDAHRDIIFANQAGFNQICWGGKANQPFSCVDIIESGSSFKSKDVAVGDINNDGQLDLVFANKFQPNHLCFANGNQKFTCETIGKYNGNTKDVTLADMNQDGWLDSIFANKASANQICLNTQEGRFDNCRDISTAVLETAGVAVADINGDHYLDIFFANGVLEQNNQMCLGDGRGGVSSCTPLPLLPSPSLSVLLADFNSDAVLDAVLAHNTHPQQTLKQDALCLGDRFEQCSAIDAAAFGSVGIASGAFGLDIDSLQIHTPPLHGDVNITHKGSINYTPRKNFQGLDSFIYALEGSLAIVKVQVVTINSLPDTLEPLAPTMNLLLTLAGSGQGQVQLEPLNTARPPLKCQDDQCHYLFKTGDWIRLTPLPAAGSSFVGWGAHPDCQDNLFLVQNVYCVAYFKLLPVTLTVTTQGQGQVTSTPAGIDCREHCQHAFEAKSSISLTAQPDPGWTFKHWQGDCDVQGQVTLTAAKQCQAVFQPLPLQQLRLLTQGKGTIQTAIHQCQGECVLHYPEQTAITLTALPQTGFRFTGWQRDCGGQTNTTMMVLDHAKTCVSRFEPLPPMHYVLSVEKTGQGQVRSIPAGIDCAPLCSAEFSPQSTLTLEAIPAEGFHVLGFEGDCNAQGQVTLTGNKTCQVVFAPMTSTLTVTVAGQGQIRSELPPFNCAHSCQLVVNLGEQLTLQPIAAAGWRFQAWQGDCTQAQPVFMNRDKSCHAQFIVEPIISVETSPLKPVQQQTTPNPLLTVATVGSGNIVSVPKGIECGLDCIEIYQHQTTVRLTAQPADHWRFSHWNAECGGNEPTIMLKVTNAQSCQAHFIQLETPTEPLEVSAETMRCHIYALHDDAVNNSQLLALNWAGEHINSIQPLGQRYLGYDLEGLAWLAHLADYLLATAGHQGRVAGEYRGGYLYRFNRSTETLTPVGATGFDKISALAVHPLEKTLWGWGVKPAWQGLIQIDPHTAQSYPLQGFDDKVPVMEGLAWHPQGHRLYAAHKNTLWVYDSTTQTLTPTCQAVIRRGQIEGLERLTDATLLLGIHHRQTMTLIHYDPDACQSLGQYRFNDSPYNDIESIVIEPGCPL